MRKPSVTFRSVVAHAAVASLSMLASPMSEGVQTNQPPVAGADVILTRSTGQPVAVPDLLLNDIDPEGRSLIVSSVLAGTGGTVSLDGQTPNLIVFKPGRTFNGLGTFTYVVTAAGGASSTGTVTVRNPFLQAKGIYAGPLSGNPGIPNSVGYMQLSLSSGGIATVQLDYGRERFRFKGIFEMDGSLVSELKLPNGDVRKVTLNLPLHEEGQPITGTFSGGDETVMISLPPMLYRRSSPPPFSGAFTVILPAEESGERIPKGIGYGVLKVSTAGNASFVGKLGDGDRFSMRMFVQPNGTVPVFAALYGYRGSVAGTLNFADVEGSARVHGTLSWFKPKIRRDSSYPNGFQVTLQSDGAQYTAPNVGNTPLTFPSDTGEANASFYFQGVGFGSGVLGSVFVPSRPPKGSYWITAKSLRKLELQAKIDARSGVFVGSVLKPNRAGRRKFSGVVVQALNVGAGVIEGGKDTGVVVFEPNGTSATDTMITFE